MRPLLSVTMVLLALSSRAENWHELLDASMFGGSEPLIASTCPSACSPGFYCLDVTPVAQLFVCQAGAWVLVGAQGPSGPTGATGPEGASGVEGATGPAGSGGGTWTTVMKVADESHNSSAVVADDAVLNVTLLANTQYCLRLRARFITNATADLKYRVVFSGTTTRVRRLVRRTATTDIAQTIALLSAFDSADIVLSTTGLNPWLEEDIILQVGASGGILKLQWGQGTSNAGPTTCLEGSVLEHAPS